MIKYELQCEHDHTFESWFRDSAAYDRMAEQGVLQCPECGSARVAKALMAPRLARKKGHDDREEARRRSAAATAAAMVGQVAAAAAVPAAADPSAPVPAPPDPVAVRQVMRAVRTYVEQNFDYVGNTFADEARKIHYGDSDARAIYGEATPEEQTALEEEGVEIYSLPVLKDDA